MCKDKENDPWQEETRVEILEDETMMDQFPKEEPVLGDGEMPDLEYVYGQGYDRVIPLDRRKYTASEAHMRMNSICVLTGCKPTGPMFFTARYYCLRVLNKVEK